MRLLLYFLLFYFIYRFVRLMVSINRIKSRPESPFHFRDNNEKKTGETTIDYIPDNNPREIKHPVNSEDEYIEYEEIKKDQPPGTN